MKNSTLFKLFIIITLVWSANFAMADVNSAPITSIGIGNGNTPQNTGPIHNEAYFGEIPVYVTAQDDDLDNYHFRVIKDGGAEGHTCTNSGDLFADHNQGYASTTLLKDTCGFVFNKSVYVSPEGFTNKLIVTLDTRDIVAFGGEGDYWLIVGAVDTPGHRTNPNYLLDPRIKITVLANPPAVNPAPVNPIAVGGGNTNNSIVGGNGPIVGSYGGGTANTSSSNTATNGPISTESNNSENRIKNLENSNSINGGLATGGNLEGGMQEKNLTESVSTTSEDNLAQVISSGFNFNWLWLILILTGGGLGLYYILKKD